MMLLIKSYLFDLLLFRKQRIVMTFTVCVFSQLLLANAWAQTKVIAFGDSITSGMFRTADNFRVCSHNGASGTTTECRINGSVNIGGYAPYLANSLTVEEGTFATVYNWGYSGELTFQMVNRINTVMNATPADYIAIMGGANDAFANFSSELVQFNIDQMITSARNKNITPIVATVTPNWMDGTKQLKVIDINVRIRSLLEERKVQLADQYERLIPNFSAYQSGDFLHLNDLGNRQLAIEWIEAIQESRIPSMTLAPIYQLLLD